MERRTFISAIIAATAFLAIPSYGGTKKDEDTQKLFIRFFMIANDQYPNERQLKMFDDYQNGKQVHKSPRQTGMTTFMLTLALFETKCKGNYIAFFPHGSCMLRICQERTKIMEARLGKSIHDGEIIYPYSIEKLKGRYLKSKVKCYVMNDAKQIPSDWNPNAYNMDLTFFFGTGESTQYKHT